MLKNALLINWIETRSYFRDKTAMFRTFIYPVLLLVILDYMFGGTTDTEEARSAYRAFLISGMAAMTIVTTALFGFAVVLVSLRHEGKLKLYEVLPLENVSYLLGFGLSRILVIAIFVLLFVTVADFIYNSSLQFTIRSVSSFLILTLVDGFTFISNSGLTVTEPDRLFKLLALLPGALIGRARIQTGQIAPAVRLVTFAEAQSLTHLQGVAHGDVGDGEAITH